MGDVMDGPPWKNISPRFRAPVRNPAWHKRALFGGVRRGGGGDCLVLDPHTCAKSVFLPGTTALLLPCILPGPDSPVHSPRMCPPGLFLQNGSSAEPNLPYPPPFFAHVSLLFLSCFLLSFVCALVLYSMCFAPKLPPLPPPPLPLGFVDPSQVLIERDPYVHT